MKVTIEQAVHMNFQPDPNLPQEPDLPLLEKQFLVDQVLQGQDLPDFAYRREYTATGPVLYVTKGWPILSALKQFSQDAFPTWDEADRQAWRRLHQGG
jgi:hypothetical protein